MNDADSFDGDRLSGSLQYADDHTPQTVVEHNRINKDQKKLKKKEVNLYRLEL